LGDQVQQTDDDCRDTCREMHRARPQTARETVTDGELAGAVVALHHQQEDDDP
jgi:hypothetical protein